jgi:hypothetical protein
MNAEAVRKYTTAQLIGFSLAALAGGAILAGLVAHFMSSTAAPADSPLKVRGGAMTFRTKANNQFSQVPNTSSYCVLLGSPTSTVSLALFQPKDQTATTIQLTNQAQIDFFGHTPDGGSASNNGIQVLITSSCNGVTGLSALLQPEGSNSQFYDHLNNAADEDNARMERFQDIPCSKNPPTPLADEDTCEHMKQFIINSAPTPTPNGGSVYKCRNGECRVEFVVSP